MGHAHGISGSIKKVSSQIKSYKDIKKKQAEDVAKKQEELAKKATKRGKAREANDQAIQEHMGQAYPDVDWGTVQEVQERQRRKEAPKTSLGLEIAVRPSDERPKPEIRNPKTGQMQANPAYQTHKKREFEFNRVQTQMANIQSVGIHKEPMAVETAPMTETSKYYPTPGENVPKESTSSAVNALSSNLSAAQARSQIQKNGPVPSGATPFPEYGSIAKSVVPLKNTNTPS
jgi:hypothetical protein